MVEGVVPFRGEGEITSAWCKQQVDRGTRGSSNGDNDEEAKVVNEVDWGCWLFLLGIHVRCQGLTRL